MANKKISELTAATASNVSNEDVFPFVDGTQTKKITAPELKAYAINGAVRYDGAQVLVSDQKQQALANLGANSSMNTAIRATTIEQSRDAMGLGTIATQHHTSYLSVDEGGTKICYDGFVDSSAVGSSPYATAVLVDVSLAPSEFLFFMPTRLRITFGTGSLPTSDISFGWVSPSQTGDTSISFINWDAVTNAASNSVVEVNINSLIIDADTYNFHSYNFCIWSPLGQSFNKFVLHLEGNFRPETGLNNDIGGGSSGGGGGA